jgi:hypothetical protein
VSVALSLSGTNDSIAWAEVVSETQQESALRCGTGASVNRVRAITTRDLAYPILVEQTCDVVDSLAVAHGGSTAGILVGGGSNGSSTIRNSTAVGLGAGSDGIDFLTEEGDLPGAVEVSNTIAMGAFTDLFAYGESSTIAIEHSNFDGSLSEESGTIIDAGNNQKAPPIFAGAGADNYAEAAGSPTIDAGVVLTEYITPTLDLAGNPRVVGGKLDIGAYEFVPQAPPPPPGGPAPGPPPTPPVILSALKLSPKAFHVSVARGAKKKAATLGTKVSYTLSAAAKVTFEVDRKAVGRRVGKGCVKQSKGNASKPKCTLFVPVRGGFTESGKAGPNSFSFNGKLAGKPLAPGDYRLSGSADSSTATASFTVLE